MEAVIKPVDGLPILTGVSATFTDLANQPGQLELDRVTSVTSGALCRAEFISAVGEINVPPARLKTAIGTAAAKRSKAKTKEAERSIRERREELRAKRGLVRAAFDDEAAR